MPRGKIGGILGSPDLNAIEEIDRQKRDPLRRVAKGRLGAVGRELTRNSNSTYPSTPAGGSPGGVGRDFSGFVDGTPTPDLLSFDTLNERVSSNDSFLLTPLWYEVVGARGSVATMDTRLDVSLNEDGTLKQVVDDSNILTPLAASSIDLSDDFVFTGFVRVKNSSGAPGGGEGDDGDMVQDEADDKLYMKCDGTWKSVTFA
jgi:hypothetical protein